MGWLWSDPVPSSSAAQDQNTASPNQSSPNAPAAPPTTQPPSTPLSRDELAEQELQSFLKELEPDIKPSSSKYNRVPRLPPPPPTSVNASSRNNEGGEPLSEQLLPKTMSCRVAFDEAFYCNSFGGRFNDLYRYGTLRSCSENWNNFWFCMRTRGYSDREKEAAVKEHYRRKETMKYAKILGKESSEDVWKSREKKLEWGEAFNVPFPEFDGSDEEWNRQEIERRRGKVDGSMG
jgi:Protein of unknown function (DUF3128)